jgi:hypothetical protein
MNLENNDVLVSINKNIREKHLRGDKRYYASGWEPFIISIEQLAIAIKAGFAYSATFKDGERSAKNFTGTNIVSVDVDHGLKLQEALDDPWCKDHLAMLYTTASHTEQHHRFRLVFRLPEIIKNTSEFKNIARALCLHFGGDLQATDPARPFYGNSSALIETRSNTVSNEFLETLKRLNPTPTSDNASKNNPYCSSVSGETLAEDLTIDTASGIKVLLSEIKETTSIYCPVHRDKNPSAFAAINEFGAPYKFIHCSACGVTWRQDGLFQKHISPTEKFNFVDTMRKVHQMSPEERLKELNDLPTQYAEGLLKTANIHFYNDEKFKLKGAPEGLTFIRSPKGTGKTESMVHLIEDAVIRRRKIAVTDPEFFTHEFKDIDLADLEALEPDDEYAPQSLMERTDYRVLLIGHRRALIRNLCERLKLYCYLDDMDKRAALIPDYRKDHYGVCLDSIYKVSFTSKPYDLIIIDEVEQVLAHLLAETVDDASGYFSALKQLISTAKNVVVLDADVDWCSFLTLTSMRSGTASSGRSSQVNVLINEYKVKSQTIEIVSSRPELLGQIKKNVADGKKIYVSSNSKLRIERTAAALKEQFPQVPLLYVTSENSNDEEMQDFITNIKHEILKYQVVLASPSLSTGIDITFPDDEKIFDCVYGIYEPLINTHTEIDQQLARVRHPKDIKVWISPRKFNFETNFDVVKSDLLQQSVIANTTIGSQNYTNEAIFNEQNQFIRFAALAVSRQRSSKNSLKTNYILHKKNEGWEVLETSDDDNKADGKLVDALGKKLNQEEFIESILTARPLKEDDYEQIDHKLRSDNIRIDPALHRSHYRMALEIFYGKPVDQDLILNDDHWKTRKSYALFSRVVDRELHKKWLSDQTFIEIDVLKTKLKVLKDSHAGSALLRHLFMMTPIMDATGFIANHEYSKEDLIKFTETCLELKSYIETQFQGVSVRSSIKNDPSRQLTELLKLVGLKTEKTRSSKRSDGGKTTYYQLSNDHLERMLELHKLREYRTNPWELINQRYNF